MSVSKIVDLAIMSFEDDETCVLCTVVRLDGSGYGRPGARLLLTPSGEREGYISGGCLEKDLCRRVWEATNNGPRLIVLDTRGNSVEGQRYGTGCEGLVYVLCQRVDRSHPAAIDVLRRVQEQRQDAKLLTIYRSDSSDYHVGDQWTEASFADQLPPSVSQEFRSVSRNASIVFTDEAGNEVEAAIEIIRPRRELVIFGAGDDVIPVVQAASVLDWEVTVVGHRPELADPSRFPTARVQCGPHHLVARSLSLSERTDVVVMTHDFARDGELLPVLLDSPVRSIGLLGPKRRLGRLVQELYKRGRKLSDNDIARLRSPIGLDIGAISPAEIAMAIMAELIAMPGELISQPGERISQTTGRIGQPLHDRLEPLHEPVPHLVAS
ncbi:XdhC family protein [Neorhodopirellula pilleata]|uniref:Putative xanthine dehydrogenase subunit A n=1 Tax=Neorhodopirellula pilleata TaxID=2714738 RepID=A0A5C6A165_9BACT|nr:XdhC/CoxI family protein [Neorhodopirellula pilleata]TWT93125.1 putative xanthine dehydrogenase subunit A [Neorhodopirellula pilleata]